MTATIRQTPKQEKRVDAEYLSRKQGRELLDQQARKYLGMSGKEFARRYREGTIEKPDRSDVIRIAMLLPFAK